MILENLRRLCERADVLVRVPVIPGVNASDEEMERIAALLAPLRTVDVEPLAYHRLGEGKYAAMGLPYEAYEIPSDAQMQAYREMLKK